MSSMPLAIGFAASGGAATAECALEVVDHGEHVADELGGRPFGELAALALGALA